MRDNTHKQYESACDSIDPDDRGREASQEVEMLYLAVYDIAASPVSAVGCRHLCFFLVC